MYGPEVKIRILEEIAKGVPLDRICREEGMPAASTVRMWIANDVDGFAADSARAYSLGYEVLAEECLEIADTPHEGVETIVKADGGIEERRGDMLQHRKLRIDTRMRLLGKWAPKRYGEKLETTHQAGQSLMDMVMGSYTAPADAGGD